MTRAMGSLKFPYKMHFSLLSTILPQASSIPVYYLSVYYNYACNKRKMSNKDLTLGDACKFYK